MSLPSIVPIGLSEGEREHGLFDQVAIVFPLETCKLHESEFMLPVSVQWADDFAVISQGYKCGNQGCTYTLKVLRDLPLPETD